MSRRTLDVGDATHPYVPVRYPLTEEGSISYGPPCEMLEEAEAWVLARDEDMGCASGYRVEVAS